MNRLPKGFVIVGTQRTGTTLIKSNLESHPQILCIGEAFLLKWSGELGYRTYIRRSIRRILVHYLDRRRIVAEYLDNLFGIPGYSAIGFKFMCDQFRKFSSVHEYLTKKRVRILHIVRRNVLRTLISREIASRSQVYHTHKPVILHKFTLESKSLIKRLDKISRENIKLGNAFHNQPYIQIAYEDFCRDKETISKSILDFLHVDASIELSSPLAKIAPHELSDILLNYQEIVETLNNTPYQRYLRI